MLHVLEGKVESLPQSSIAYYLSSIVEFIKKLSPIQKALIPQVHCLVSLILVMPATNASSERSFSALRRVKTFLRTTMTQLRLNNSMILIVHGNGPFAFDVTHEFWGGNFKNGITSPS